MHAFNMFTLHSQLLNKAMIWMANDLPEKLVKL